MNHDQSCRPYGREYIVIKVTNMSLSHNHNLNKILSIKTNQATNQYSISSEVARKILGPLSAKTLRNFIQTYPPSIKNSSVMVCNAQVKVKILQRKFVTNMDNIPSDEVRHVFSRNSPVDCLVWNTKVLLPRNCNKLGVPVASPTASLHSVI